MGNRGELINQATVTPIAAMAQLHQGISRPSWPRSKKQVVDPRFVGIRKVLGMVILSFIFFLWFLYTQSLPPNIQYPPWSRPGFILIWNHFGVFNIRGMGLYMHSQGFASVLRMCIMGLMTMPPIPCFDYGRCGKHW